MNNVNLIGRLTRDPEPDRTPRGEDVCRLRLAVPRPPRPGVDDDAVFITVVAYGGQATSAATYLAKGRAVGVSGRLEHREWTDAAGARHSVHEVLAHRLDFLDRPRANGSATTENGVEADETTQ